MQTTGNTGLSSFARAMSGVGQATRQARPDDPSLISHVASSSQLWPAVSLEAKEDVQFGTAPHGSQPQPTPSVEAIAFASGSKTYSSAMKGSSLDHAPGAAPSLFDWNEDGSWSLRAVPSQQDTDYQDNPAPGLCNTCGDGPAKPDNRPPESPFLGQPPSVSPSSLTPSQIKDRISSLNDKDTEKVVNIYGGSTLKNKILVLIRIEQWISKNGRKLIQVVRTNGKKGGVAQVICGECQDWFISIQKVAEHITSFHWHLPIWSCRKAGCTKSFRRKQECDRHEESAHGIVPPKKAKRQRNATRASIAPSSLAAPIPAPTLIDTSEPQVRRSRPRHLPPTHATNSSVPSLAPPESAERGRSSSVVGRRSLPIPRQEQTTGLRNSHSSPNLKGAHQHSLPSVPPSTPLEMSSSYSIPYNFSPPVPPATAQDHPTHDDHLPVPGTAPATDWSASGNTHNVGWNTMPAPGPSAPVLVQYPAPHYSVNPPTESRLQQTQQSMRSQGTSSQYGSGSLMPQSYALSGYPHLFAVSPTPPSLNVPNASPQYLYPRGAGHPSNMGMGPPPSRYSDPYGEYIDEYSQQRP